MQIQFLNSKQRDIAEFLLTNTHFRVIFMEPNTDYTCHDILVDLLIMIPKPDRDLAKQTFNTLAHSAELPYYESGKRDDGEILYQLREEIIAQHPDYF